MPVTICRSCGRWTNSATCDGYWDLNEAVECYVAFTSENEAVPGCALERLRLTDPKGAQLYDRVMAQHNRGHQIQEDVEHGE